MQSRKPKYSVHSLLIDAEYGPRQSSPEVSLCRLESLKERNGAVWGRTDRQAIPHHSSGSVWESQDHAQGHSNPSILRQEVIAALALSLSAGQDGCWTQHHNTMSREQQVCLGPLAAI